MKFKYCPDCGNEWIYVPNSLVAGEYFSCVHCDSLYKLSVTKINPDENKSAPMKRLALILHARTKVTYEELKSLGKL